MRATEKNSTDSAMGRRPVSVARRTKTNGHFAEKLEMACFDWSKFENSLQLLRSNVPRYLYHDTVTRLSFKNVSCQAGGFDNEC